MPVTGYSNIPQVTHLNTFCLYKGKKTGLVSDMFVYLVHLKTWTSISFRFHVSISINHIFTHLNSVMSSV